MKKLLLASALSVVMMAAATETENRIKNKLILRIIKGRKI